MKKIILTGELEESNQTLPSAGLGDTISKITTAIGIKPCDACKRRAEALNKHFPFLKLSREVTDLDIEFIDKIQKSHTIQSADVDNLFKLYNDLFTSNMKRCNCPQLIATMIQRLVTIK